MLCLTNYWLAQPELLHSRECSIQAFANILVRRVWELIDHSHYSVVPRKTFLKKVLLGNVTWKAPWALNLHPIIKDTYGNFEEPVCPRPSRSPCRYFSKSFTLLVDALRRHGALAP